MKHTTALSSYLNATKLTPYILASLITTWKVTEAKHQMYSQLTTSRAQYMQGKFNVKGS